MLTIEEKDYDLNFLINFEMLREILIRLARDQKELQTEFKSMKDSNKERDFKILKLEGMIKEAENRMIDNYEIRNKYLNEDKEKKEDIIEEKKEKIDIDSQQNNIDINIGVNEENKNVIEEQTKTEEIKEKENEDKKGKNEILNQSRIEHKKAMSKENSQKDIEEINNISGKKSIRRKSNFMNLVGGDKNSKQLINAIRECNSRINQLEIQLAELVQREISNIKKDLNNHDLENQSDFKMADTKINEILEKLTDQDKKIEDCIVKCASVDILNLIKDNGDGTVDAAKLLSTSSFNSIIFFKTSAFFSSIN